MKKHNGIRPLDILILLQLSLFKDENWMAKEIASKLKISASEVSESLNRSAIAGFISADKKILMRSSLIEFLEHGLKYVFPQIPGGIARGIPTSHSAPPLNKLISSDEMFVWPYARGNSKGQSIEPLFKTVPEVSQADKDLHELLALTDAVRIGKIREKNIALKELKKRIDGSKK